MDVIQDFIKRKKIVTNKNLRFKFLKLCPYCKADLIYKGLSWGSTYDGDHFMIEYEVKCDNEPDFLESKEWDEWFRTHSIKLDKIQACTDKKVLDFLNNRFTFRL